MNTNYLTRYLQAKKEFSAMDEKKNPEGFKKAWASLVIAFNNYKYSKGVK